MHKRYQVAGRSRRFDWHPQRPDHRDLKFEIGALDAAPPAHVDLRARCGRVEDQGDLGSCTAHAATGAMEFLYHRAGKSQPELSRLFCYFASRVWIEGTEPDDDSGCYNRDVMKACKRYGVPLEKAWPYMPRRFGKRPPATVIGQARNHQVTKYLAVEGLAATKACLAAGYPIVIGFAVPRNMVSEECAATGVVEMPENNEDIIGGHAVLCVGYDDERQLLTFKNSWGTDWGDRGYGYLPYSFVSQGLADDFWTVRAEEL